MSDPLRTFRDKDLTRALDLALTDVDDEPDSFLQAAARAVLELTEWPTDADYASDSDERGAQ